MTAVDETLCERTLARVADDVGPDRVRRALEEYGATISHVGDRLIVEAPSRFVADLLARRLGASLRKALLDEAGAGCSVEFRVAAPTEPEPVQAERPRRAPSEPWTPPPSRSAPTPVARARTRQRRPAAPLRRLDEFVVSPGSALAHREAVRLAEASDSDPCTPLFLHGECGVGKTHLLQGIVERFRSRRPGATVRWTTGEAFTNAYIQAIQANRVEAFRRDHRGLDLLCIDDVHFLSNKTATQNELLHTFDAMGACGARLAMASDAHPRQISRFCEGLVSRFLAGMVVRVERPDRAARVKIVASFCARRGLRIEDAAAEAIADRSAGSVRELEGAVIRIDAVHRLLSSDAVGATITVAEVDRALGAARTTRRPIAVRDIARRVGEALTVDLDDLFGRSRHKRVVQARSLTAYLARELTNHSFPEIARELNKPNHSTVITQCKRVAEQIAADELCDTCGGGQTTLRALYTSLRTDLLDAARPA